MDSIGDWLIANYPVPLFVGIAVVIFFYSVLAVIGYRQGREVSLWPPKIGPRPAGTSPGPGTIFHITAQFSDDQMNEIVERLRMKRPETPDAGLPPDQALTDQIPEIPERVLTVLRIRREVQRKIRELGMGSLDGWAGISLAAPETFNQLLEEYGHINKDLMVAIGSFLGYTEPAIWEDDVSEEHLADIETWAKEILPRIPPPPDTQPGLVEPSPAPPMD